MNQFVELTDEEFTLIKQALDLLSKDEKISKAIFKGLLLGSAANVESKVEMERMFKEDEEKERQERIVLNEKITTLQYKLIQIKKFLAAKPGMN